MNCTFDELGFDSRMGKMIFLVSEMPIPHLGAFQAFSSTGAGGGEVLLSG
jgi:hypothetical protein